LQALHDPANLVLLSVVSVWEMQIKSRLGKLPLRVPLRVPLSQIVAQQQANGLRILAVTLEHVLAVASLPNVHKDPFDRLLVAQANVEGAELLTADAIFDKYPVRVWW